MAEADAPQPQPSEPAGTTVDVQEAQLPEAAPAIVPGPGGQVDILLHATMAVTATLGQVSIQVSQLLQLGPGSVLKLERQVGEPIDLYLRGVRFATGHLVVVGDNLAVRVKEILPNKTAG